MDLLKRLFGLPEESHPAPIPVAAGPQPASIKRRVLCIIHNPVIRREGGRKAKDVFGWNDPDRLAEGYIQDIRACSYGYANYEIAERIEVNGFPVKRDGFVYTDDSFLQAWRTQK